jgi:hypothetical protein
MSRRKLLWSQEGTLIMKVTICEFIKIGAIQNASQCNEIFSTVAEVILLRLSLGRDISGGNLDQPCGARKIVS